MQRDLLRKARRFHDLTQQQLAENAGINLWRFTRVARGQTRPTLLSLRAIAEQTTIPRSTWDMQVANSERLAIRIGRSVRVDGRDVLLHRSTSRVYRMSAGGRGKSLRNLALIWQATKILKVIQPASVQAVCDHLFTRGVIELMARDHRSIEGARPRPGRASPRKSSPGIGAMAPETPIL